MKLTANVNITIERDGKPFTLIIENDTPYAAAYAACIDIGNHILELEKRVNSAIAAPQIEAQVTNG